MKELLEAGVHFGHQTKRWNPKMKEYIFGERNGIYIIDLQKTLKLFKDAMRYVGEQAASGKTVLFVGTKRQAQEAIAEEANRAGMYYVNQRWLGGLLTNIATVQRSIKRLKELDAMAQENSYEGRQKKEVGRLERERKHLQQNLAGIKDMVGLPDLLFVIDSNKEAIAVKEARKLGIRWSPSSIPIAIRMKWITSFPAMMTPCAPFACSPPRLRTPLSKPAPWPPRPISRPRALSAKKKQPANSRPKNTPSIWTPNIWSS